MAVLGPLGKPSFEPAAVLGIVRLNSCTKLWNSRHVFKPDDQIEQQLRFRHVSGRFILVRKDHLNRPDKVRQVQPTLDFLAQPFKPAPGHCSQRIVHSDWSPRVYQWTTPSGLTNVNEQLELPRVVPEPPNRGKKIMCILEGSVIEILDGAPVRMIRIVQQGTGTQCEQVARPDDDAERMGKHIVLPPRHLSVIITVKAGTYNHEESPGRAIPS